LDIFEYRNDIDSEETFGNGIAVGNMKTSLRWKYKAEGVLYDTGSGTNTNETESCETSVY
jgi:hypothetical protein